MNYIQSIKSLSKLEISDRIERIRQTFNGIPIVRGRDNYPYSFFTLTDYLPAMQPKLIEDMADLIVYYGTFDNIDIIVSEADRGGGPLAHAVAVRTNIPYTLANWYPKEIPGQIGVKTSVGFSGMGFIYLNGLLPNKKVILIDDLLSSGGTALALLEAIEKGGSESLEVIFVAEKLGIGGREKLKQKYDIPIRSLIYVLADGNQTTASIAID